MEDNEVNEGDKIETSTLVQQHRAERSFNINSAIQLFLLTIQTLSMIRINLFHYHLIKKLWLMIMINQKKLTKAILILKKKQTNKYFFLTQQNAEKFIDNKSDATITNKKDDFHEENRKENKGEQLFTPVENHESFSGNVDLKITDEKIVPVEKGDIQQQLSPDSKKVDDILPESENEQTNVTVTKLHSDQQKKSFLFDADINKSIAETILISSVKGKLKLKK